ncbi:RHS repeat-associated core domain-containing protein, partial [Arachidicoccus rhizosphaerae]
ILETNSYYPFGLQQKGIGYTQVLASLHNKYTYNGKELQEDLGLDQYDYGTRFYDAQIGRWHTVDPLSDAYVNQSSYNYAINNPILLFDYDGMAPDSLPNATVIGYTSFGGGGIALPLPQTIPRIAVKPLPPPNPVFLFIAMLFLPSNWNNHQSSCELCKIRELHAEAEAEEDKQEKIWNEDILNKAEKQTNRSGSSKSEQHKSEGGYDQALKDFEKLSPLNVVPLRNPNNEGKVGTLRDGSTIIVREKSLGENGATLERQYPEVAEKLPIKIRYGQ